MNEKRRYGILWSTSFLSFAQFVWGLATYVAMLLGAMVLAVRLGNDNSIATAVVAVLVVTGMNWIVFVMIEHGELKRMNQ